MIKRIEMGWNPQKHRGRHKRSYLEESFDSWLMQNKVYYISEHQIKRYDLQGKYIKSYYIDFYFPQFSLGIELDGAQHKKTIKYDKERDDYIKSLGINILRVSHSEYVKMTKIDLIRSLLKLNELD